LHPWPEQAAIPSPPNNPQAVLSSSEHAAGPQKHIPEGHDNAKSLFSWSLEVPDELQATVKYYFGAKPIGNLMKFFILVWINSIQCLCLTYFYAFFISHLSADHLPLLKGQ